MMLAAAAAWFGVAACARRAPAHTPVPGPIASALLALAAELGSPPVEVAATWTRVSEIAAQVAQRRKQAGGDAVAGLNTAIMQDLGYEREVDSADLRFVLLPSVIGGRRGSCLGLGALYLIVAELLGVPLDGVLVPGHFFVRAPGPPPRNVELLRRGEVMPDQWYRSKYGRGPLSPTASPNAPTSSATMASAYARAVSVTELLAIHWFNVGNLRRVAGDIAGAELAYARAAAGFPAFAEAQASLGAVRQLRGRLADAAVAYRAAARARPDLPGLTRNMTLLDVERTGQRSPTPHEQRPFVAPSIQ